MCVGVSACMSESGILQTSLDLAFSILYIIHPILYINTTEALY